MTCNSSAFPTRHSERASQVRMVTSVPLSLSSNVTTRVISPTQARSAESKVISWTILVGVVSSANRAVKRSSRVTSSG
jgi:hypothetical protein